MAGFVLDASALTEYAIGTPLGLRLGALIGGGPPLHTVSVCGLELVSALRRLVHERRIDLARAEQALSIYVVLPIARHDEHVLLSRVWRLRSNFSPYDAPYVALAEALGAPLMTTDERLARAVTEHTSVELLTT